MEEQSFDEGFWDLPNSQSSPALRKACAEAEEVEEEAEEEKGAEEEAEEEEEEEEVGGEAAEDGANEDNIEKESEESQVPAGEVESSVRCTVCGTGHLLRVDITELGELARGFRCSDAGAACPALRQAFVDSSSQAVDGDDGPFLALCGGCGTTRLVTLDVMGLGIDFRCCHINLPCEDNDSEDKQISFEEWERLVEQKKLVLPRQVPTQSTQARPSLRKVAQIRYRDDQVVSHTGERFVKEVLTPSPGPGCSIGGVLGARKAGRLGLGLRKRPKEEVERVSLSGKQRAHVRLDSQPRRAVRFETRGTHSMLVPGGQGAGRPRSARPSGT